MAENVPCFKLFSETADGYFVRSMVRESAAACGRLLQEVRGELGKLGPLALFQRDVGVELLPLHLVDE